MVERPQPYNSEQKKTLREFHGKNSFSDGSQYTLELFSVHTIMLQVFSPPNIKQSGELVTIHTITLQALPTTKYQTIWRAGCLDPIQFVTHFKPRSKSCGSSNKN